LGRFPSFVTGSNRPILWKKSDFLDRLNSGSTIGGKPTHHIEWFFGSSLTFAALLLG
jgi:hypothetical protein